MPPRRFKKKSVRKIVEKRVARVIEKYEKTRTESNNAGGSRSANTEGTVAPEVQGCSYKTFMNGKPHFFSGTEGVVGTIAYMLELPQELSRVHHTFHVSNLKKCHVDEPLVVSLDGLHIDDKLYFIKENIEIRSQKVEAKLYPKLSRFVGTLGKELSIPGNMNTNSERNICIFFSEPVLSSSVAT
ncbi:hypothetical protein Tco_0121092 [Tanacetum coccineum]